MQEKILSPIRIITLGESTVGKTAFINKYVDNIYKNTLPTIGFNIYSKNFSLPSGESIKIIFEDTSGQERYHSLSLNFIRKANGVVLMYDITQKNTFDTISNWCNQIWESQKKDFPVILLGNKCNLENERQVQREEGEQIANEKGIKFLETSNKNGININEPVKELVDMILKNKNSDSDEDIKSVKLDRKTLRKRKKKKC
jgi:small GTP-binding protein